ncbi:MAG TPA: hypothetical protein PLR96_11435 [Flavobacteriales bacterium]|nr:hypothetical protein [Flavobacteriales bacterium]
MKKPDDAQQRPGLVYEAFPIKDSPPRAIPLLTKLSTQDMKKPDDAQQRPRLVYEAFPIKDSPSRVIL